ncbi:MAG: hypothetical protein ABR915_18875 [Thermoguttaceae bacterium]|jgi:hypothetical protein
MAAIPNLRGTPTPRSAGKRAGAAPGSSALLGGSIGEVAPLCHVVRLALARHPNPAAETVQAM